MQTNNNQSTEQDNIQYCHPGCEDVPTVDYVIAVFIDCIRHRFPKWNLLCAHICVSVSYVATMRKRFNIPKEVGEKAGPGPQHFTIGEFFTDGLGI